jgi:nitrate reductase NapE component
MARLLNLAQAGVFCLVGLALVVGFGAAVWRDR